MVQRSVASIAAALRGAADHHCLRAAHRAVHVCGAGGFSVALHLHDVPFDVAAAGAAGRRPDLRDRGGRNRPLLSGDHRVLRLRLRGAVQGIQSRLDRGRRRSGFGRFRRVRQWRDHRENRHTVVHDDARDPVLLGRHGDRAVGREVLCAARRRGELGMAVDRRAARLRLASGYDWLQQVSIQALVDRDHRRRSLAHPDPSPLRRAHAFHRRFQRRLARRRHRRRSREDQGLHADGRFWRPAPRSC